ncbi:hypothetical protein [Clostridium cibarium]|uniref:Thioesterase domain-containing protein n=1 Tax=Clostridium cibarium TaxID=2762247 RepID=A0ABR8PZ96_9CLOT|nr:hypothetical protein [Clostridium cibarium]MBD7913495.1 hypothetical protein [Clostridium cibarium]
MFLFGHSFGSFLAQEYIICSIEKEDFCKKKKCKIINVLTLGNHNKRFEADGSQFAWICSDLNVVKKYEEDPYCGKVFSIGFFYYLMKGLSKLYKKERLS